MTTIANIAIYVSDLDRSERSVDAFGPRLLPASIRPTWAKSSSVPPTAARN
jgi:hypothetical protein